MSLGTIGRTGVVLGSVFLAASDAIAQPDRILDTPTGWGYIYAATPTAITNAISTGSRPFSIELAATGQPSTYDTLFVVNSGPYAVTGALVTYGQTPAGITNWLNNNGLRLLDLEAFDNGGGTLFMTAIGVPNSGATAAPGWGWLYNATATDINNWISGTNLRLIDLDTYVLNGTKYYSAVAVPNTGANAQSWWYSYNVTESEVATYLTQNSARLISLAVESGGTILTPARFTVVMVGQNPGAGWFHGNLSSTQVNDLVNQYGARLTCLRRYVNGLGQTRFAVARVDNANAQTRRIRDRLWANTDGITGFTLKQVDGPWLAGVNETFKYEPCSTVKLLHAIYAIRQCSVGADALSNAVLYRNRCASCPFTWTCNPEYETLSDTLELMLQPSDNRALIALERRYGLANINGFADAIGCPDIQIDRQDCQCAVVLNSATTAQLTSMIEQAADGTLFSGTWFQTLLDHMNSLSLWGYNSYPTLSAVINQEAAAIGLPDSLRNTFRNEVRYANKGGSYECGSLAWGTEGGWAAIPHKVHFQGAWFSLERRYVFALFGHNCSTLPTIVYSMKEEMLREQIAEALATWKNACRPVIGTQPQGATVANGGNVSFNCQASAFGQSVTYQWRRNGVNLSNIANHISGANGPTLSITNVVSSDAGVYTCVVSTACGSDTSNGATLVVTCYPDCNADGVLNLADFGCFQTRFATAHPYADCNGDGVRNLADFGCFQTKFALGCP
jgi:hypothetical protein